MRTSSLWQFDERVGVGLSPETRSAADGRLFTTRAIAMQKGVGLMAAISGLAGAQPPESGLLFTTRAIAGARAGHGVSGHP